MDKGKLPAASLSSNPLVVYIRQQFTEPELHTATLQSLGLAGSSARLQLRFQDDCVTASPKEENYCGGASVEVKGGVVEAPLPSRHTASPPQSEEGQGGQNEGRQEDECKKEQRSGLEVTGRVAGGYGKVCVGGVGGSESVCVSVCKYNLVETVLMLLSVSVLLFFMNLHAIEGQAEEINQPCKVISPPPDQSGATHTKPSPPNGINPDTFRQSLANVLKSNFDAASRPLVITVTKYLDNIIRRPLDMKYRTINMSNRVFQDTVAAARGGVEVLTSMGFVSLRPPYLLQGSVQAQTSTSTLSHQLYFSRHYVLEDVLQEPSDHTTGALDGGDDKRDPSQTVSMSVLLAMRQHLREVMDELEVPLQDRPATPLPPPPPPPPTPESAGPVVAFDPFKPFIVRTQNQVIHSPLFLPPPSIRPVLKYNHITAPTHRLTLPRSSSNTAHSRGPESPPP